MNQINESTELMAVMPLMDIATATRRFSDVAEFVKELMKPDVDFGIIPGTTKPTLLKPGAEKLTTFFGLTKRLGIIDKVEDWTGKDHNGEPFFYYLYRCGLYRGELLVAEADGSCNSFESKYRWRKAERTCPECGLANIRKSNKGGWYCWVKTGGCGGQFPTGDVNIERQEVGRIANPDVCDQVNTFQKMAQKRALVAATLLAVNASEFFTQDMEDYIDVTPVVIDAVTKKVDQETGEIIAQPVPQSVSKPTTGQPSVSPPATKASYKFPSIAAEDFYRWLQEETDDYWTNGFHFSKTMEKLGINWSILNDQQAMAEAFDILKKYVIDKLEEPIEAEAA